MAVGSTALKFFSTVVKGVNLKFKKVLGVFPAFGEVAVEKLVGLFRCPPRPPLLPSTPILNKVQGIFTINGFILTYRSFFDTKPPF